MKYIYDISIVMAYHNRKEQALKTLNGFEKQYANKYNFEVVFVDDNSSEENNLSEEIKNYSFPINLIRINSEEKGDVINPCGAYNKGFEKSKGKIIIIQNPECYHVGDIIKHTLDNLSEQSYFSYSCYTTNSFEITDELLNNENPKELIRNENFNQKNSKIGLLWYNHPTERNVGYHFCSSVHQSNLSLLGGFDKRFAHGYCFDDCELILSVEHNLQLDIKIIGPDDLFVVHQFHKETGCQNVAEYKKDFKINRQKNKSLYEEMKGYHEQKQFNYPKILHLYWDKSPLSFLNLTTILSFNEHNKFWKINVFVPTKKTEAMTWRTNEQKLKYNGKCYFHKLYEIPNVFVHEVDLDEIGFHNDASEVIKSDYFRYYVLQKHGGIWSDFDIIYTSSIEDKMNFKEDAIIFECFGKYKYFPIGFFLCKKNNEFFQFVLDKCKEYYNPNEYQSIGSVMWDKLFRPNQENSFFIESIKVLGKEYYLPYEYNELDSLFSKEDGQLPEENIGIHWFNGSGVTKKYVNDLEKRINNFKPICFLDKFVTKYL